MLRERIDKASVGAGHVARTPPKGGVLEAGGWVMPETLALLCALAAKARRSAPLASD